MKLNISKLPGGVADVIGACTVERFPLESTRAERADGIALEVNAERCALFAVTKVPGFGSTLVYADNDGRGLTGDEGPIDFLTAGCETQIRSVEKLLEEVQREFGIVPANARRLADRASGALRAAADTEARLGALADALYAGEHALLGRADLKLQRDGLRNDFKLGCNTKGLNTGGERWKQPVSRVFNAATLPLTWGILEPYESQTHYEVTDEIVDWCTAQGMPIKGHALIWFSGWEARSWQKDLSFEETRDRLVERARTILTRYAGRLSCIELINEPIQANPFGYTVEQVTMVVKAVHDVCRELSPQTRIMVSFYDEDGWRFATQGRTAHPVTGVPYYQVSIPETLDAFIAAGVKIDVLGMQAHKYRDDLLGWYRRSARSTSATAFPSR